MEMKPVRTDKAPAAWDFMAQANVFGNLVFTGGMVPMRPGTLEIPPDFDSQARLVLDNLEATLNATGTSLRNAIKVNIYMSDLKDWPRMNEIYKQYINRDRPPGRTTVQVSRLVNDFQIEIECVAYIPGASS